MKRFYDVVDICEVAGRDGPGWQVTLDGRGLKTVKGTAQIVASEQLALDLAEEWRGQGERLDPKSFRLRDGVDYAIDVIAPDPAGVAATLVQYGDTDTLLYRADPDEPLYARQQDVWEPIVADFEARERVALHRVSGIVHRQQDDAALAQLRERLVSLDPFVLSGVQTMTSLAASLIIGLSAAETDDADRAMELWAAASLEEEWQAELWGRDAEAEERRANRQSDFLNAWHLARLSSQR